MSRLARIVSLNILRNQGNIGAIENFRRPCLAQARWRSISVPSSPRSEKVDHCQKHVGETNGMTVGMVFLKTENSASAEAAEEFSR
jgi:hypothetical protein